MVRVSWLSQVQQERAIAVIRAPQMEIGVQMAQSVTAGGMELIEITWNSDRPADLVQHLRSSLPHCCIGAGTLLTVDDMKAAIEAGAQFLFTPHTNVRLIETAVKLEVPIVPGALTPSEIVTAWQAGATCVKVFPIQAVGGASYIKSLREPLGQIPLIPTGGVTIDNAPEFIAAGAVAVGLSGQLFPKAAIEQRNWGEIRDRAARLMKQVVRSEGRGEG